MPWIRQMLQLNLLQIKINEWRNEVLINKWTEEQTIEQTKEQNN